ncbi:MAG: PQQ-like beta-propeller repeat protein [Gemmataceae bacterium]|nr:PQQ-like beta-propeller repeat protein [Gemmataceae bacterium]MCI0741962.1 PQQ-like beta-propeller repeat protein [Gemmataceae bacterium]
MKKHLAAIGLIVLTVTIAWPQDGVRLFTRPSTPSREVLDRLGLTLGWKARVPVEGMRDGFFTLQLLPGNDQPQLVVQTLAGSVVLLDAETGDTLWRTSVADPYWQGQPVAWNDTNLFVLKRAMLFVLNRANGKHRLSTRNEFTKFTYDGVLLDFAPSAAPVADDKILVTCLGDRLVAYDMPDWEKAEAELKGAVREIKIQGDEERLSLTERLERFRPVHKWAHTEPGNKFEQPPALANGAIAAVSHSGLMVFLERTQGLAYLDYKLSGGVSVAMGQHGRVLYVGSQDANLYAWNIVSEGLDWRFVSGGPIMTKPEVTDKDVFLVSDRAGLYRVDRASGREVWLNKQAERFLSANQKFVYARDRTGRLLVLDYARGTTLAAYDMRDWTIAVPNELTDRFYLASHDGQILCLHHRDLATPQKNKTFAPKIVLKKEEEMKEPMEPVKEPEKEKEKEEEKPKNKEKDKAKDDKVGRLMMDPGATRCYVVAAPTVLPTNWDRKVGAGRFQNLSSPLGSGVGG